MGSYITDLMLDNIRIQAVQKMCKSYKPEVSTTFVLTTLGFDSIEFGIEWLTKVGCVIVKRNHDYFDSVWNTKDSVINPSNIFSDADLL